MTTLITNQKPHLAPDRYQALLDACEHAEARCERIIEAVRIIVAIVCWVCLALILICIYILSPLYP